METQGERLRRAREKAGYPTAKSAAEAMNIPVATYIQHENGGRGYPASKAERYGKFFRVAPEWLLYGKPSANLPTSGLGPTLFIKGKVAAGVWTEAQQTEESEWVTFTGSPDVTAPIKDRFGLRVEGDSMNEIYPSGTVLECVRYDGAPISNHRRVIVQRQRASGEYETTVKEYVQADNGAVWLAPRSTNPAHQAFRCDLPDAGTERVEIIAIVVAAIIYEG